MTPSAAMITEQLHADHNGRTPLAPSRRQWVHFPRAPVRILMAPTICIQAYAFPSWYDNDDEEEYDDDDDADCGSSAPRPSWYVTCAAFQTRVCGTADR